MNLFEVTYSKKFPFIQISLSNLFAIFFNALIVGIFAFIFETLLDLCITGYIYDRGFLIGPFIPLYFFMTILILLFVKIPLPTPKSIISSFLTIAIGISAFEFIVGNVAEWILDIKLWSYDGFLPLSYRYVSLTAAFLWGCVGTFYLVTIVPLIKKIADKMGNKVKLMIVFSFGILFVLDILLTIFLIIKNQGYHELYEIKVNTTVWILLTSLLLILILGLLATYLYRKKK